MKHDLNNSPSYEHMQGTPKPSHLGSQSKSPSGGMSNKKNKMVKDSDGDGE